MGTALKTPIEKTALPQHVLNATGKGMDNIDQSMFVLPRIKLLQDMSPEVKKTSEKRIPGAEAGDLMLHTSDEVFKDLYVINLKVKTGYVAFNEHTKMPFRPMTNDPAEDGADGLFSTIAKAEAALFFVGTDPNKIISTPGKSGPPDGYTILESHRHFVHVIDPESLKLKTPAVVDFIKTKVAISKTWNTQITTQGGDRFSSIWKLGSKVQTWNDNSWFNYSINFHDWATQDLYEQAEKTFAGL